MNWVAKHRMHFSQRRKARMMITIVGVVFDQLLFVLMK